jgi:uncharacterized protein
MICPPFVFSYLSVQRFAATLSLAHLSYNPHSPSFDPNGSCCTLRKAGAMVARHVHGGTRQRFSANNGMMATQGERHPNQIAGTNFRPTRPEERIQALDVLRGLALLMILVANMPAFNSPIYYLEDAGLQWWSSRVDHIADALVQSFVQNESVALFSLLFGLGFAMQMRRAESSGSRFLPVYARRLTVLMAIGLIHAYLIWMGDILALYGLLGFPLLLFRKLPSKVLLSIAVVLYLVAPSRWEVSLIGSASHNRRATISSSESGSQSSLKEAQARQEVDRSVQAYGHGSWLQITRQRARDYAFYLAHNQAPTVFPMFLFGLYAGKRKLFEDIPGRIQEFRRFALWGLVASCLGVFTLRLAYFAGAPPPAVFARPLIYTVLHTALLVFYVTGTIVLHHSSALTWLTGSLAAAGRLALSNYILQSVVCTFLYYSYGLALYGTVGPAMGVAVAIAVFAFQLVVSTWWSRRFTLGPIEWLWRSVSYGQWQEMRSVEP